MTELNASFVGKKLSIKLLEEHPWVAMSYLRLTAGDSYKIDELFTEMVREIYGPSEVHNHKIQW